MWDVRDKEQSGMTPKFLNLSNWKDGVPSTEIGKLQETQGFAGVRRR